jgi:hypothetical protein
MSIFGKGPPRVEIFIHHHLFGVRPPNLSRGVCARMRPLCCCIFLKYILKREHNGVVRIGNSSVKHSNSNIIFYMYYIYYIYLGYK